MRRDLEQCECPPPLAFLSVWLFICFTVCISGVSLKEIFLLFPSLFLWVKLAETGRFPCLNSCFYLSPSFCPAVSSSLYLPGWMTVWTLLKMLLGAPETWCWDILCASMNLYILQLVVSVTSRLMVLVSWAICYTVPQNHKTLRLRILVVLVQMGSSEDYTVGDVEGALILRMQSRQGDRRGQGGLCAPALSHTPFHLLLYGSTRHLWHDEWFCLLNWDGGSQEVKME